MLVFVAPCVWLLLGKSALLEVSLPRLLLRNNHWMGKVWTLSTDDLFKNRSS